MFVSVFSVGGCQEDARSGSKAANVFGSKG